MSDFNYTDLVTIKRHWEYMVSERDGKIKYVFNRSKEYASEVQLCSVYNMYKRFRIKLTEYEWMCDSTTKLFLGFTLSNGVKLKIRKIGDGELTEELFLDGEKYQGKLTELLNLNDYLKTKEDKLKKTLTGLNYDRLLEKHLTLRLTDNPNVFRTNMCGFGFSIDGGKMTKLSRVKLLGVMKMYGEVVGRITFSDLDGNDFCVIAKINGSSQVDDRRELMVIDHTKDGSFYRFHFKYPEFLDLLAKELIYNCTF